MMMMMMMMMNKRRKEKEGMDKMMKREETGWGYGTMSSSEKRFVLCPTWSGL
jgi:hypothetical protein